MKSVFVTNSKSWAMEYHNLIMGCHPTAQIHYSQRIYKQRSQHCHPDMADVLGPDLHWNMIYTCQDSGKNRLHWRLVILSREFLLHGSLDTIIPVLKHGEGEGAGPCWTYGIIFCSGFLSAGPELCLPPEGAKGITLPPVNKPRNVLVSPVHGS